MIRKKWIVTVLAVCTTLLLISCGMHPEQKAEATEEQQTVLTIGSPIFAPYFFVGEDGNYTGADKEIAEEAFRRLGCEITFQEIIWGERNQLLRNGEVDCVWGCFVMNGRENCYQWAGPYLTSEEAVVVAADSDIQSVDELTGRTVAVRIGSKAEDYFLGEMDENDAIDETGTTSEIDLLNDLHPVPETLATFNSMKEAFVWFGKGYADAVVDHKAALVELTKDDSQLYRFLDESLFTVNLGVAFRKTFDSELVNALSEVLDEMNEDGTIQKIAVAYQVDYQSDIEQTQEENTNEK